jgi:hypothetical protein
LAERVAVLKIRMSIISSILRTTMHRISKRYGYNGDNRLVTLQDFYDNPCDNLGFRIWAMLQNRLAAELTYQFEIREAPTDGKQYARRDNQWTEITIPPLELQAYDNFKVYQTNDFVWHGNLIYKFNSSIGAAGYGPTTHPYAWTPMSINSLQIGDVVGLSTQLSSILLSIDGKAALSHTHPISGVVNLQNNLDTLTSGLAGKAATSHVHTIANITGLQTSLDTKATTTALTTGLAGKANTSHTHPISSITSLQTELNSKASTSHTHDISVITGVSSVLEPYQKKTMPSQSGGYAESIYPSTPGQLYVIDYNGGPTGKVYLPVLTVGARYFFYQSVSSTYPVQFFNVINVEGKTFSMGAKSYIEVTGTPDGYVIHGDITFPPNGTILSESCDYTSSTDAAGNTWSGNFLHAVTYANGSGGSYTIGTMNESGCYYPYGYVLQTNVNMGDSYFYWQYDMWNGYFTYMTSYGNVVADGTGSSFQQGVGGWSAQYGDLIYDTGSAYVKYDGMGWYYIENYGGGPSYPPYGEWLGNFSGAAYVTISWNGNQLQAGTFYEDRYADGSGGVAYTQNGWVSWYSYSTYIGQDGSYGYNVFSDGSGGYYTEDPNSGGGGGDPGPSCSQGQFTGNTTSQTHQTYINEYGLYVDNGTDTLNEYNNSDCSTYWETASTSYQPYGTVIWTREYYNYDEWGNQTDGPYYQYFYSDGNGSYYYQS